MSKSLEETLRESRELTERYKKFLADKEISDKQMAQTQAKVQITLNKLAQTKETIKQIDSLYDKFQQNFSNAIDKALNQLKHSQLLEYRDPEFKQHNSDPKDIAKLILKKKKVTILTGAGISAESGIPTFRDKDGFWDKKKQQGITPELFLSFKNFQAKPMDVWNWVQDFYNVKNKCKINPGHKSLDNICRKLKQKNMDVILVTQNIDNFHTQAFDSNKSPQKYSIYQIHGNILKIRCDKCSESSKQMVLYNYSDFRKQINSNTCPKCPKCGQFLRPNIMFFDEFYSQKNNHCDSVKDYVQNSDLLIVIGTSLQTGLSRNIAEAFTNKKKDIIQIDSQCFLRILQVRWLQGNSGKNLQAIEKEIK